MKFHLDLFSGIGGFSIAAMNCGYTTIGFCEKEPYAQQILKERFGAVLADADGRQCRQVAADIEKDTGRQIPHDTGQSNRNRPPRIHADIFTLNGADYAGVDLLTGGFPCQPFSVAGKRRGAEDDRALWPEMLRVIDGAKPHWLIGENVAGIVTMELDNILSDLEGIGYAAWPLVIPACAVDARHRRDRVWIIGSRIVAHAASQQDNGERGHRERGRDGMGWTKQASRRRDGQADHDGTCRQCKDVADAEELHGNERGEYRQSSERQVPESGISGGCSWQPESHWLPEPELGRVAHGIPNRAHRLRGLGNAIVPAVAEEIIRAITSTES